MKKNIFLGGASSSDSQWRQRFISKLNKDIASSNPSLKDSIEEPKQREKSRTNSDFSLYAITPKMTDMHVIAEVVDDSNKRPDRMALVVLNEDGGSSFEKHQTKTIQATRELVERNGVKTFDSLEEAAEYVNSNVEADA